MNDEGPRERNHDLSGQTTAFRAHGDEFYLLREWGAGTEADEANVTRRLDLVRQNVAALRVESDRGPSIFDLARAELQSFQAGDLSAIDRKRLDQHLTGLRELNLE